MVADEHDEMLRLLALHYIYKTRHQERTSTLIDNVPGHEIRTPSTRPERFPYGRAIWIEGEKICLPTDQVREMFLMAAEMDVEPCEFEGENGVYRVGPYIFVPENSGL